MYKSGNYLARLLANCFLFFCRDCSDPISWYPKPNTKLGQGLRIWIEILIAHAPSKYNNYTLYNKVMSVWFYNLQADYLSLSIKVPWKTVLCHQVVRDMNCDGTTSMSLCFGSMEICVCKITVGSDFIQVYFVVIFLYYLSIGPIFVFLNRDVT